MQKTTIDLNGPTPTPASVAWQNTLNPFVGDVVKVIDERRTTFGMPYTGELIRNERNAHYIITRSPDSPDLFIPGLTTLSINDSVQPVVITLNFLGK